MCLGPVAGACLSILRLAGSWKRIEKGLVAIRRCLMGRRFVVHDARCPKGVVILPLLCVAAPYRRSHVERCRRNGSYPSKDGHEVQELAESSK